VRSSLKCAPFLIGSVLCACSLPAETAAATFTAVIQRGCFHQIDLTDNSLSTAHAAAESEAAAVAPAQANNADVSSQVGQRDAKFYKRRLVQCVAWEAKLRQFMQLRERYRFLPALPCVGGGDSVTVHELNLPDVLEAAEEFWTPIEREAALNANFDDTNQGALAALLERRLVIEAMADLDLNEEVRRLQKQVDEDAKSAGFEPSAGRRGSHSDIEMGAVAAGEAKSGAGYFRPMEVANIYTLSRNSKPPTAADFAMYGNGSMPAHVGGMSFKQFVCGTIPVAQQGNLARLLFRLSRGNALLRFGELPEPVADPVSRRYEQKSIFYIVYLGLHLKSRIERLCQLTHANLYTLPEVGELEAAVAEAKHRSEGDEQEEEEEEKNDSGRPISPLSKLSSKQIYAAEIKLLDQDIADKRRVSQQSVQNIRAQLSPLFVSPTNDADGSVSSPLLDWLAALHRESILCQMMQQAHFFRQLVALEGWCPTDEVAALREAVRGAVTGTGSPPAMMEVEPVQRLSHSSGNVPPTAFPLNKFTASFQGIVDTYGVPRYKEVNPGLFTIITFPFLFGIMVS
jgi:hypothetical protein